MPKTQRERPGRPYFPISYFVTAPYVTITPFLAAQNDSPHRAGTQPRFHSFRPAILPSPGGYDRGILLDKHSTQRSPEVVHAASVAVIIPAFENPGELTACLRSIAAGDCRPSEVIIVDDCSQADAAQIEECCRQYGARYLRLAANQGPAAARNAGALASSAEILLFLDSDVTVHPGTIANLLDRLAGRPELSAIFGAYDAEPTAPGAVSRFRNLLHHYVHLQSAGPAGTFWAGCGAIRRSAFFCVGGFSEYYRRPSIEDVELGHRLHASGFAISLDPSLQVTHTKQWSLVGMFRTDLFDRAVPWTALAWERRGLPVGLNFGWVNRLCVVLAGLALCSLPLALPWLTLAMAAAILALNWPLYVFICGKLGLRAMPGAALAHLAHFFAAFLGFLLGTLRFLMRLDRAPTFRHARTTGPADPAPAAPVQPTR